MYYYRPFVDLCKSYYNNVSGRKDKRKRFIYFEVNLFIIVKILKIKCLHKSNIEICNHGSFYSQLNL